MLVERSDCNRRATALAAYTTKHDAMHPRTAAKRSHIVSKATVALQKNKERDAPEWGDYRRMRRVSDSSKVHATKRRDKLRALAELNPVVIRVTCRSELRVVVQTQCAVETDVSCTAGCIWKRKT